LKPGNSSPGTPTTGAAVRKAEDVVSTMLARGFVLSKDALRRAQTFDGRHHHLLSSATSRVAYLDRRLGLSDKFSAGTAAARGAARGVDERFQVTERAWGAFAAAGEAVAGSPYASRGAAWVSAAVGAVARAASDVGAMTMEKVGRAEGEGADADGNAPWRRRRHLQGGSVGGLGRWTGSKQRDRGLGLERILALVNNY